MGKDFTLFAKHPGIVVYQQSKYVRKVRRFWLHHCYAAAPISGAIGGIQHSTRGMFWRPDLCLCILTGHSAALLESSPDNLKSTRTQAPNAKMLVSLIASSARSMSSIFLSGSAVLVQVHVVPRSAYVVPEGNRVKAENSRKTQRKKEFPPRALLREQFERDVAEAPISAQPQAA